MADMNKLKQDALRRKQEFEDKKRSEEFRKQKNRSVKSGRQKREKAAAAAKQKQAMQKKKPKKSPARWVVDILLVLGALLLLIVLFNPYWSFIFSARRLDSGLLSNTVWLFYLVVDLTKTHHDKFILTHYPVRKLINIRWKAVD